jgi:hypothetical protein
MEIDHVTGIAETIATELGKRVNDDGINPVDVAIGGIRGSIVFWLSCTKEGQRVESLNLMRQIANEEIDKLILRIASGVLEE